MENHYDDLVSVDRIMKLLFVLCSLGIASSLPQKRFGNPDEYGPYYQGDIKLPLPSTRNGLLDPWYRWPNGQVPYTFSSSFNVSNIAVVEKAMESYDNLTGGCIQFIPRTTEVNYLEYVNEDDNCYSSVGMQGGMQLINYPQWCIDVFGSVQHEMYHALGFFHEQSRADRDDYVSIQWWNIEDGAIGNFAKYSEYYVSSYGQDYDYGSVMHYSSYAFSKNGRKSIVTAVPEAQDLIGQRIGLSMVDIAKLKAMYEC